MIRYENAGKNHAAGWIVEDSFLERAEIIQEANRSAALVTTFDDLGPLDLETFGQGDFVSIVLPVGQWQWETSRDGQAWHPQSQLESFPTSHGPGLRINLTLDGAAGFAKVWSRFRRIHL